MDASTRHQLKQNELGQMLAKLRNFSDERLRYVLIALAVLLVAVVGWRWWSWSAARALERDWDSLTRLESQAFSQGNADTTISELRKLIDSAADPTVRGYSRLVLATALSQKAATETGPNEELLKQARDALKEVVSDKRVAAPLEAAAGYALATTYESLRDFDQAKATYKAVAQDKRLAGSPYVTICLNRLSRIDLIIEPVTFTPGAPPPPATQEAPPALPDGDLPPPDDMPDDVPPEYLPDGG